MCKEEKKHLHDILNIMPRSMSKSKETDVPSIYPLKGKHKEPEHVMQPQMVKEQMVVDQIEKEQDQIEPVNGPDVDELPEVNEVP